MFTNLKIKKCFYIILLCISVSCQGSNSAAKNETATIQEMAETNNTQGCLPPCWEGITPGKSTEAEVVSILKHLEEQSRIKSYEAINVGNYMVYLGSGDSVQILLQDQNVYWIQGLSSNSPVTVSQINTQFGNPEAYFADSFYPSDDSCTEWDSAEAYSVPRGPAGFLVYASQGMTFRVRKSERWPGLICPDVLVIEFDYYEPRSLDSIFDEKRSPVTTGLPYGPENMIPWNGYGAGY